jgi:hypothetical protein
LRSQNHTKLSIQSTRKNTTDLLIMNLLTMNHPTMNLMTIMDMDKDMEAQKGSPEAMNNTTKL